MFRSINLSETAKIKHKLLKKNYSFKAYSVTKIDKKVELWAAAQ